MVSVRHTLRTVVPACKKKKIKAPGKEPTKTYFYSL